MPPVSRCRTSPRPNSPPTSRRNGKRAGPSTSISATSRMTTAFVYQRRGPHAPSLQGAGVVRRCRTLLREIEIPAGKKVVAAGQHATTDRDVVSVLHKRAQALVRSPDRLAAREIAEQVMALPEGTIGSACETHDELAGMLLRLRSWALYYLTMLGDSAMQAILVGEPVTADSALLLGPDHPDTLSAQNNLALAYQQKGRAAEALTLFERALAGRERVLGADHPDTLSSQSNLAIAYQEAGWFGEALTLFERALAGRERVLGADHPDTLSSQSNLAIAYQEAGWFGEALTLFERALAGRERVLGADHPDTLSSQSNLAIAYQEAGWLAEALTRFEQALAAFARVLGPDHPQTLISRANLASAYRDAGL